MDEEHTLAKSYRQYLIVASIGALGVAASVFYLVKGNNVASAFLGIPGVAMLIGGGKKAINTKSAIDATSGPMATLNLAESTAWKTLTPDVSGEFTVAPTLLNFGAKG